ncbi:MAG: ISAs1 family transposase [Acidobacteria bacterium]|nr:ISAs1 family transposase [Acidobacteriota bacterium]
MDYSTVARPLEGAAGGFVFSLNSLYARLGQLTDQRRRRGVRYPLAWVLLTMVVAKLAGADTPQAIADWVSERAALFRETFELKSPRMPHHNTYRRIMQRAVVPAELERVVGDFLAEVPQAGVPVQITLDGKTLRGTLARGETRGLHLLAAYWPEVGLVLAQVEVDPQTNELGAAPQLLKTLDLQGKIITGDALFAQRELSLLIGAAGGDYVWTVKDNQPRLRADIEQLFEPDGTLVKGFNTGPTDTRTAQTINKGHGRIETRTLTVTSQLQATSDWPYLAQVFRLERMTQLPSSGTVRCETVYGLTSLTAAEASPARLQELVRTHWQQENGLHYRRDVTFKEDATRMKTWRAAHVLAILNNLALALLVRAGYRSLPQARRHYAAHPDRALQLLLAPPSRL